MSKRADVISPSCPGTNRREFLALTVAAALSAQTASPPNILFILADDMGYGDLSCFGQKMFATPNIDTIARDGIRFTQAYAGAAICAPSRCCLMTGKHTGHSRIRDNYDKKGERVSLLPDDVTVAEVLKRAGYRTGLVGKWGIGEAGTFGIPNDKGFDEFFGFLNQEHAHDYYPEILWDNESEFLVRGNEGNRHRAYVQNLFTDRALDFIERNLSHPFFLYLAYTVPHASTEVGADTGDGYVVPQYGPFTSKSWPNPEKGYAEMIHLLDDDVGKLLASLKDLGIEQNTLLIFCSDNGGADDSGHRVDFFKSNGPLRGTKASLYEGGIRIPMSIRWPKKIHPGRTSDTPWAFYDVLPTLAEIAGVPVPKGLDGISVAPLLVETGSLKARDYLYWESYQKGFHQAIRSGDWKAIRTRNSGVIELFNLRNDRSESQNLAAQHPDLAKKLANYMSAAHVDSSVYVA
jgi:arylsulfatase A-like enzyme